MTTVEKFVKNYDNYSVTENGALGYKTSLNNLVDLNFLTSSLRTMDEEEIENRFEKAYYENPKYAVKWMFFLRDIKEGNGERRSFRICLKSLANNHPEVAKAILPLVATYGRYDDIFSMLHTPVRKDVIAYIENQLKTDIENSKSKAPVSLLGKWMPSINSSSEETRHLALDLAKSLGMNNKEYRKTLSSLRENIGIIERYISSGKWAEIDYSQVPAKANLKYDKAFFKNDELRRLGYFKDVILNDEKINISGLAPYELVHKLRNAKTTMETIGPELLWDVMREKGYGDDMGFKDAIVVTDVSGSMFTTVDPKSSVSALDVAESLSIYFSEQLKGPFKDKAISFSARPEWIDMSNASSLKEKLQILDKAEWGMNTNIEAVFDMLLDMAKSNDVSKDELPKQIVIISDMEFDMANRTFNGGTRFTPINEKRLFDEIGGRFEEAGYELPKLVFWNVNSRTHSIPMIDNEKGIALLSGFSQNSAKIVTKNPEEKDPAKLLMAHLDSERYSPIEKALNDLEKSIEESYKEAKGKSGELSKAEKYKAVMLSDINHGIEEAELGNISTGEQVR